MNDRNHLLSELSSNPTLISVLKLSDQIKFSYPQSSLVIVGDYRVIRTLPALFDDLVKEQFEYGLYLCHDHAKSAFLKSIRDDGGYLYRVGPRDVLDTDSDNKNLLELFKENKRVIFSVSRVSQRLRYQYWKLLNRQIRTYFLNKKVSKIPYFMLWIDSEISSSDPSIFDHFRILGLWGDEYGLRFTLFLDKYSLLSSPARTLFGIVAMVPGLSRDELTSVINYLTIDNSQKTLIYKTYFQMDYHRMLIVSPTGMFSPFLAQSGLKFL